jgi:hypothetical protein
MSLRSFKYAVLAAPFLLMACDGYEMVRTDAFPYGNQRTAGTGVAYVLAKMAPEKELKLETTTVTTTVTPPAQTPVPPPPPPVETPMEKVFNDSQSK